MDQTQALAELPAALAVALRLREEPDELIARALGIEPTGVALLLEVADAKLQRLLVNEQLHHLDDRREAP